LKPGCNAQKQSTKNKAQYLRRSEERSGGECKTEGKKEVQILTRKSAWNAILENKRQGATFLAIAAITPQRPHGCCTGSRRAGDNFHKIREQPQFSELKTYGSIINITTRQTNNVSSH
jgi:hypothetical protein